MEIFDGQTIDATEIVDLTALNGRQNRDGDMYFIVSGELGGATVTLTLAASQTARYAPLVNGALTDEGVFIENVPEECYLKVVLSGSTGTTDIDFHIK